MKKKIQGVMTALVTPFRDQRIDDKSLERLIINQIQNGIDGFVIHGTTGEAATTTPAEKKEIFNFIKSKVPANLPLVVGTGGMSTQASIEDSIAAEKLGADALLVVVPPYLKPPQRGLFEHFKKIADAVSIPILLYNVPSRTITSLEVDTIKKLSEHPNIIGIKEASGQIDFAKKIRAACGESFLLLSGDDATYPEFLKAGGQGVISVASHILPKAMKNARIQEFRELIDFLFVEANPIPVKRALMFMGLLDSPELRLPLVEFGDASSQKLKALLKGHGIIT